LLCLFEPENRKVAATISHAKQALKNILLIQCPVICMHTGGRKSVLNYKGFCLETLKNNVMGIVKTYDFMFN